MLPDASRATFSSLRARREAYQIASDILYEEPIDVRTVACSGCGRWLDVHGPTVINPLFCSACGAKTPLPPYLRAKYQPRVRALPPVPLNYVPSDVPVYLNEGEPPVPLWLAWFTLALLAVVLVVSVVLLIR